MVRVEYSFQEKKLMIIQKDQGSLILTFDEAQKLAQTLLKAVDPSHEPKD